MDKVKKIPLLVALIAAVILGAGPKAMGADPVLTTSPCPTDFTDTGVSVTMTVHRLAANGIDPGPAVGSSSVGVCECVILRATVSYPVNGNVNAFFSGGTIVVRNASSTFTQNVTPVDGVPLIGDPNISLGAAVCGQAAVNFVNSQYSQKYCIQPTDVVDGQVVFFATYTGAWQYSGNPNPTPNQPTATTSIPVSVDLGPTCSIPAPPAVCQGGTASFTATGSGPATAQPYTFQWVGPNGFTQKDVGLSSTVTIPDAQAVNGGEYTATVIDNHGCSSPCSTTLTVKPTPSCDITPEVPVCQGTTATYTSAVTPSTGVTTHSWSISGNGTITSVSTTGPSVTVAAGLYANGTSFTLTDNITVDGCPSSCNQIIQIKPTPSCDITPEVPICEGSTATYTSTVTPSTGVTTHSWSISGNGTITSVSKTGPTVTVAAGPFANGTSFILTDDITVDGCPSSCRQTIQITPCAPKVCIEKLVTCGPLNGATCDATSGTYSHNAYGVVNTPDGTRSFCYQITISVCPDSNEGLKDIVVTDADLGDPNNGNQILLPKTTLAIGDAPIVVYASKSWAVSGSPHQNTATVNANGLSGVAAPPASDSAFASVTPISVTCSVELLAADDLDNAQDANLLLLDTAAGSTIVGGPTSGYHLTVKNTSPLVPVTVDVTAHSFTPSPGVTLANCTVVDANEIPVVPQPADLTAITLAPGEEVHVVCDIVLPLDLCPGPATISFTPVGTAVTTQDGLYTCILDENGDAVQYTGTPCPATITCQPSRCVTRTQGYWFNHVQLNKNCVTLAAALEANGGTFDLGFTTLEGDTALGQALGYFWAKGKNDSALCRARQKAATQLIAAIANTALLNGEDQCTTGASLVSEAQAVLSETVYCADIQAAIAKINAVASELDAFNNSGDDLSFPEGWNACSAGKAEKAFIEDNVVLPPCASCVQQ